MVFFEPITIAIPFYNNLYYLRRALTSLRNQTTPNWSCIVVDDCGPCPESQELIRELNDPRISYFRAMENGGLAMNWNRCLDISETDLVMLLHSDDELKENYIEKMIALINLNKNASGYFCQTEIIDKDGKVCFSFPDFIKKWIIPSKNSWFSVSGDRGLASLLRGNYIMCPTMIYRKSRLYGHRFSTNWRMVLDLELYANILESGGQLVGSNQFLYRYRRHAENQTTHLTENLVRFHEEVAIYNQLARRSQNKNWQMTAMIAKKKTMIKLNLLFQVFVSLSRGRVPPAIKFARMLTSVLCG